MPIPSGARWVRLQELERGLELDTGRRHVLVLPIPTLALSGPTEKTLHITHPPEQDYAPLMPLLEGVRVQVKGIIGDPTPQTDFTWRLVLDYTTRAKPGHQRRTQVVWELTSRGGVLPPDVFRRTKGKITRSRFVQLREEDRKAAARAKRQPLRETAAAGGDLTIQVRATIGGQQVSAPPLKGNRILAHGNPPGERVLRELRKYYDEKEVWWLYRIACVESEGRKQFYPLGRAASPSLRVHPGEPVMNHSGDGGVGLMQITDPRPGPGELWDWRMNIRRSRDVWNDKLGFTKRYLKYMRAAVAEMALARDANLLTRVNMLRRQRGQRLFSRFVVPELTADMIIRNAVRGYNGYAGQSQIKPSYRSAVGLAEYRLKVLDDSGTKPFATQEQADNDELVGVLIWEVVPVSARPPGDGRAYVDRVISANCDQDP